jgi:hypothetical protein
MRTAWFLSALVILLLPAPAAAQPSRPRFEYLQSEGTRISSRNAIPLTVRASAPFRATAVESRDAMFGGHPYQVSLAALLSPSAAVMVHAERVADGSGASNSDALPATGWPDPRFHLRAMCAVIDRATIAEEHDLAFLARHGWNPEGALAIEQYLATTLDHDQEVVLSLVVHVPNCDDHAAAEARFTELRPRIRVSARLR